MGKVTQLMGGQTQVSFLSQGSRPGYVSSDPRRLRVGQPELRPHWWSWSPAGLVLSSPQTWLPPVCEAWPLLHPAKLSAALEGQGSPGLLSPRCLLSSLEMTLALQRGWGWDLL